MKIYKEEEDEEMTPEERFERIEKTLQDLADADGRLQKTDARLRENQESFQARFQANLESLQNFMSGAFERSEKRLDRIEAALVRIAETFDRHISDGHGGNDEKGN